jgi:hypothetical protein
MKVTTYPRRLRLKLLYTRDVYARAIHEHLKIRKLFLKRPLYINFNTVHILGH